MESPDAQTYVFLSRSRCFGAPTCHNFVGFRRGCSSKAGGVFVTLSDELQDSLSR